MQAPSVIIAANPYEAELCRRALVETGLQVLIAEGGEGALERVRERPPLVLVVALGILDTDPLELVVQARASAPSLPIFLIADREGLVPDEDTAARLGATRLFLRPIDIESLADAIEKRAVEAEIHDELSEAIEEFSVRPPTIDAAPLVEEAIVELEADYELDENDEPLGEPAQPLARIALRRVPREPTEVLRAGQAERLGDMASESALVRDMFGPRDRESVREAVQVRDVAFVPPPPVPRIPSMFPPSDESTADAAATGEPPPRDPIFLTPAEPPSLEVEVTPVPAPMVAAATTASAPEPLLRADDALADVGLAALVDAPDFVPRYVERERTGPVTMPSSGAAAATPVAAAAGEARPAERSGPALGGGETRARAAFDERGSFARRLESELSAAERRLFPDSPSTASARADEYEDALGDIDLDALGIDTIPGIGGDALDHPFDLRPRNGHAVERSGEPVIANVPERRPNGKTEPYSVRGGADAAAPRVEEYAERSRPRATLPDEEGDLAVDDVTSLLARLHAGAFSGALTLSRGDGDKTVFFDDGAPVGARSSYAHDRLADLLLREGTINREAHQRLRDLPDGGRRAALQLVERGLVKSSELFAVLRHHIEEILFSCFAWERGRYRLGREQSPAEDRVRLGAHPLALILEGVRRKYSLERLVERVGSAQTVLTPTTALARTLDDCALTPGERAVAELIDGERSLVELSLGVVGAKVPESSVYAVAWVLLAVGAVRADADEPGAAAGGAGVRPVATLVAPGSNGGSAAPERRTRPRPVERARDRDTDRAVDRERVLAKRAQVQDGDYFAVLGLGQDASSHEVARAFERLKREFAPDRFGPPLREELQAALTEISEVLDEAHRVLADDGMRKSYRAHLPAS